MNGAVCYAQCYLVHLSTPGLKYDINDSFGSGPVRPADGGTILNGNVIDEEWKENFCMVRASFVCLRELLLPVYVYMCVPVICLKSW